MGIIADQHLSAHNVLIMDFPKGQTTFADFSRQWLVQAGHYLAQPLRTAQSYQRSDLRSDLFASLTVAVIMLPQAIAYALIAELPPQTGLYAAIVATLVGALWGSSRHLHTGPTNTTSLVVLSTLLSLSAVPGTREYAAAAAVMAILVGLVRLLMGLVHMGIFVTFVADSVVTGFTAGAGVLIAVGQMKHLLRLDITATPSLFQTIIELGRELPNLHLPTLFLGLGTIVILLTLKRWRPSWPSAFIAIVAAAVAVFVLGLNDQGVIVLGELPRSLPPLTDLALVDLNTIREMGTGVLAVAIIGLIEATSISRTIAARSRQFLDNDQEFVGQGLANIATGLLSGYPCSGSLTRSVINYEAGSRTQLGAIFSAIWVAAAMLLLAPLAAFLPRTALAGIIVVTAYSMFNRKEIRNILRTSPGDTTIMIGTFIATLLLPLELAILTGVLISFGRYVANTSTPDVTAMLPDDEFEHFEHRPDRPTCPQLGAITISGSLYFGAARHIETAIRTHHQANPDQKLLLLRMHRVNHIDVSGLHILENMVNLFRQDGGDIYMVGVRSPVWRKMQLSGFHHFLGINHFLAAEDAIGYIFHRIMNPGICIYACRDRVWKECQGLPKSRRTVNIPLHQIATAEAMVPAIMPLTLWQRLRDENGAGPRVIDVREPEEYRQGHIPRVEMQTLPDLLDHLDEIPFEGDIVFVCRSGRRSAAAVQQLVERGHNNVFSLHGGMLSWQADGLPAVIE